jgi:hypothetical protein
MLPPTHVLDAVLKHLTTGLAATQIPRLSGTADRGSPEYPSAEAGTAAVE